MSEFQDAGAGEAQRLYQRVGELTRRLHEALRELGHDKRIEASLGAVPDAKARLAFIARVTGEAAEKVLNTVDAAQERQLALAERARGVGAQLRGEGAAPTSDALQRFAAEVEEGARATSAQLTEIMLAQDFHDLTGQTVRKIVDVASSLEDALLQLLLDATPAQCTPVTREMLDGPVADPTRSDVVANQAQVDELLASLGF